MISSTYIIIYQLLSHDYIPVIIEIEIPFTSIMVGPYYTVSNPLIYKPVYIPIVGVKQCKIEKSHVCRLNTKLPKNGMINHW